ncbi:peptidoglycan editing factor PgeF [Falsibacillus albus]|uniref:Purine nucleoside phosphorylase n=1 Tax=Falsibacillus albus TaxID=2478915 RepID=A0A3L7JY60_9BACI|nr:peptidoglycan editing factor PgeF [Falsibacillus albus]RLQ95818.1 peptidoglycan editing factor PgeF [Falsibacillus albus]
MSEPFVQESTEFYGIKEWTGKYNGLTAGFSTRIGGHSQGAYEGLNCGFHVGDHLELVAENRKTLSSSIGLPVDHWVGAEQTHGSHIQQIGKDDRGKGSLDYASSIKDTDGLYTCVEGLLLTLCFADCVPVYFIEPDSRMIGIAHAGWKGTVKGIAAEMILQWEKHGINKEKIQVMIGPSICQDCYIVDDNVIKEIEKWLEVSDQKPYNEISFAQYALDLKKMNRIILEKSGIPARNIMSTNYCTSCHSKHFFSHRKDGGSTGRMLSFIGWKGD